MHPPTLYSDCKKDAPAGCMERLVRYLLFLGRVTCVNKYGEFGMQSAIKLWESHRIKRRLLQNTIRSLKCSGSELRWLSCYGRGNFTHHPSAILCLLCIINAAESLNQSLGQ